MTIEAYIQEKQRKGVKTRTYEIVLRRIITECETRGIETDPDRIDDDLARITVTGKGHGEGKTATVPIPTILKRLLDGFKEWRSKFADHSDGRIVVWLNHSALLPYANNNSLSNAMKRIAEKVGIEFTTHSLRRLYATTLYDNGVDLLTVSRMLRHNSTRTTEQYIENRPEKMEKASETLTRAFAGRV